MTAMPGVRVRAAAAVFVAVAWAAPVAQAAAPKEAPTGQQGAGRVNAPSRTPASPTTDAESEFAGLVLAVLAGVVVLIVLPSQVAKSVARRRAEQKRG
jgi:uncharacterized membrane protein